MSQDHIVTAFHFLISKVGIFDDDDDDDDAALADEGSPPPAVELLLSALVDSSIIAVGVRFVCYKIVEDV